VRADSTRRGPSLPYSLVAGVTPCRGGWLVAGAKLQGTIFAPEDPVRMDTFVDVVDMRPAYSIIALNAPVGGLDQATAGGRTCDREARVLLGRRGSAVKSAPINVDSPDGTDVLPDHVDAITRALLPRYREVAREMAPFRQRTIYEVNSDLSFFQLNEDVPMRWSKYSERGVEERRSVVESRLPGALKIIDGEVPGASPSHLLDVAAILWTARRIFAKAAIRIPSDPEWDEQGLRMELVR
jgi:predicted RNase H-like nuclease